MSFRVILFLGIGTAGEYEAATFLGDVNHRMLAAWAIIDGGRAVDLGPLGVVKRAHCSLHSTISFTRAQHTTTRRTEWHIIRPTQPQTISIEQEGINRNPHTNR